jgi:predicted nucleic acid-binding protein
VILVDTSVVIDLLRGSDNPKVRLFDALMDQDVPFALTPFTVQEVLQGTADDLEYRRTRDYLRTQRIAWLPDHALDTYERAARIFFDLRRQGVTVRSTIEILIALTAIEHHAPLLHNDRDFDLIAAAIPELTILNPPA